MSGPEKHRWAVTFLATADHTVIVEAADRDEAIHLADVEFSGPSLCYQCARSMNLGDWYPDESEFGVTDEGES